MAVATVDPATRSIAAITLINPGTGYTVDPVVQIAAPNVSARYSGHRDSDIGGPYGRSCADRDSARTVAARAVVRNGGVSWQQRGN